MARTNLLRRAFLEATTPEQMRALAQHLYQLAMQDDMAAAKLVLQYSLGSAEAFAVQADDDHNVILVRHHGHGAA